MKLRTQVTLLAVILLACVSYASADVVWTLNNVVFADGGTATGSFSLNAGGSYLDWNINISGGDIGTYSPITYTTGEPSYNTPAYVAFADTPFDRYTILYIPSALTNAGGIVPLSAGLDCTSGPCRVTISGELDGVPAPTPEPSALLMFATGLAGLGGVIRRKLLA